MAGYVLMTTAPLAVAALLLSGSPSTNGTPVDSSHSLAIRRPTISLSIEQPAGLLPAIHPEPPVVLPGYLLPDDGTEEASHAGG